VTDDERRKAVFDSIDKDYPTYQHGAAPAPYQIDLQLISNQPFVRPGDLARDSSDVLIDNSTLLDSAWLIAAEEFGEAIPEELWEQPQPSSARETLVHLLTCLVIFERLVVDGFVFANSPLARKVASYFSGYIIPLYVRTHERVALHEAIVPTLGSFWKEIEPRARELESFADMQLIDLNHFEHWCKDKKPQDRVTEALSLHPYGEDIDIAIPRGLRDSTAWPYRIAYYLSLSSMCNAPYVPHPGRVVLLGSAWAKANLVEDNILEYFKDRLLDNLLGRELQFVKPIAGTISIPPVGWRSNVSVNSARV